MVSLQHRSQNRIASLETLQVCFSVLISCTKPAWHIRFLICNTLHVCDYYGMSRLRSVAVSSSGIWQTIGPTMVQLWTNYLSLNHKGQSEVRSSRAVYHVLTFVIAESACSTSSDSDEECLRPSLLRKRRQPHEICHPGNVPTNHQTPTGRHTTLSNSESLELQQQQGIPASDHYCSPVRQTPFAPLSPSCPSSGAPSRSCFTPTAERDLFGSPATSVPPEGTPACRGSMFDSPGLQKQMRHGDGPSKALAHISRLQRERTHLLQQIKVCTSNFTQDILYCL